jgi:hypothetical protein
MIADLARNLAFWFALAFIFAGIGAISVIAYHYHKETQLERSGAVIIGTVDSKRIDLVSTGDLPEEEFLVAYRFAAPDGSALSGEGTVDPSFYDSVEASDEIEVLYDTNDPSRHRLVATGPFPIWLSLVLVVFGGLFALIGLFLLRIIVRNASRQRT